VSTTWRATFRRLFQKVFSFSNLVGHPLLSSGCLAVRPGTFRKLLPGEHLWGANIIPHTARCPGHADPAGILLNHCWYPQQHGAHYQKACKSDRALCLLLCGGGRRTRRAWCARCALAASGTSPVGPGRCCHATTTSSSHNSFLGFLKCVAPDDMANIICQAHCLPHLRHTFEVVNPP